MEPEKPENARNLFDSEIKTDLHDTFLKNVDDLIKEFGINRDMDKDKLNHYFKDLEDQLFENMKDKVMSDKKYTKMYANVMGSYKKMQKKYSLFE